MSLEVYVRVQITDPDLLWGIAAAFARLKGNGTVPPPGVTVRGGSLLFRTHDGNDVLVAVSEDETDRLYLRYPSGAEKSVNKQFLMGKAH